MSNIYTMEQWTQDRTFNAEAGQEISADVYEQMLNCMPPESLPRNKARQALQDYNIPVHAGFLMGEPHSTDRNGNQLYLAFGMNDYGKGKHYYYLGLSIAQPELNGDFYFFDCVGLIYNGDISGLPDNFVPVSTYKSDKEARADAANYEATLYRYTYEHDERVKTTLLYDPWACFEEKQEARV